MKIESKSPYKYINITAVVFFVIIWPVLWFAVIIKGTESMANRLIPFFVCLLFGVYVFIKFEVFHFRKLEFDENGCTVKFLFLKKKYTWEKLKIKRLEKYESQYSMYQYGNGTKVAVFSPHRFLKPKSLLPVSFVIIPFVNPFNYIFINLTGNDNNPVPKGYYEYDENEFVQKMKEWNVEFDERTIKKGWKPPALG